VLYCGLEGVGAAELRIDDNQADGPVDDDREAYEKDCSGDKTGITNSVGLANDASAYDAVRHVHESAPHAAPWPCALQVVLRVKRLLCHGDARRLNAREQRESLHSFPPPVSICAHVVIPFQLYPVFTAVRGPRRGIFKANAVRSSRRTVKPRLRKGRLPFLAEDVGS
jgi:hypothetical protein